MNAIGHDSGNSPYGGKLRTRNLDAQVPKIAEEFPELKDCYHGTINVELDVPLFVVAPDHRTKPIHWDDAFPDGEVFDLLRIWFQAPRFDAGQCVAIHPTWIAASENALPA